MSNQQFNWSQPIKIMSEVDEIEIETLSADNLDRAKYAEFLTDFLVEEGKQRNFVLNLNAEWGAGKTYFLQRWKASIKDQFPVVYINAWEQDFSDDPLLTTVSSIVQQLKGQNGGSVDQAIIGATDKLYNLFKSTAPLLVKGLVDRYVANSDELDESFNQGDIAHKITDSLIKNHEQQYASIQGFRKAIEQWSNILTNGDTNYELPVFIFIDELDRCRPNYAIEMLETIKHLYCMKGVVFVVATDTSQLQHSIKSIYGQGFSSEKYLGRFFNRRLTLQPPSYSGFIVNLPQFNSLLRVLVSSWNAMPYYLEESKVLEIFNAIFSHYRLNLRTVERVIDQLIAILRQVMKDDKSVHWVFVLVLLCWKEEDFDFYTDVLYKKIAMRSNSPHSEEHARIVKHYVSIGIRFKHFYLEDELKFLSPDEALDTVLESKCENLNFGDYLGAIEYGLKGSGSMGLANASDLGRTVTMHHDGQRASLQWNYLKSSSPEVPQLIWNEYVSYLELAFAFDE